MRERFSGHSDIITDSVEIFLKVFHLYDVVHSLEHVGLLIDGCSKMIQSLVKFFVSGRIATELDPFLETVHPEHRKFFLKPPMVIADHSIPWIANRSKSVVIVVLRAVITFVILVLLRDVGLVGIINEQFLQARPSRLGRVDVYEEMFVIDHRM